MALVLDTGPILAALDTDDPAHKACASLLSAARETLVVVAPTLVEIDYWIRRRLSPKVWRAFLEDLAGGAYHLEAMEIHDVLRAAELEETYRDLNLGFVDAAVIAVCERLGEDKVATLDRRHFGAVRPRHCEGFHLLPA